MITVTQYNPKWKQDFNNLKSMYECSITDAKIEIEHIGSTSVEGLCAKPVVDIAIVYYNESDFDNIKSQLESIGYEHRGDLGITNREAFNYVGNEKLVEHHLYVCLDGILSLRNQLLFRNYLRKNKDAVIEYSKLKKKLALKYEIDEYCYHKTEFITSILKKCGLSEDEINEIKKMNEI